MKVRVKNIFRGDRVNEAPRVVGWVGGMRRREGDEFDIPDEMVEVPEYDGGKKTGRMLKKVRYFSERWMVPVEAGTITIAAPSAQTETVAKAFGHVVASEPVSDESNLYMPKRRGRPARQSSGSATQNSSGTGDKSVI